VEIRWTGTSNGNPISLQQELASIIAAVNGQSWDYSMFVKVQAGSFPPGTTFVLKYNQENSGGGGLTDVGSVNLQPLIGSSSLGASRISSLLVTNQPTTAFLRPFFQMVIPNGAVTDLTLRVGWPQLELGGFASSPIRTTSVAVTRAADLVTLTAPLTLGLTFSMYAAGTPVLPVATVAEQTLLSLDDGTVNNRLILGRAGANTGKARASMVVGGTIVYTQSMSPVLAQGVPLKSALAEKDGATNGVWPQEVAFNGVRGVPGSGGPLPTLNTLRMGMLADGTLPWNGYISAVELWSSITLSNDVLGALTSP
jgi:hypothetical protein